MHRSLHHRRSIRVPGFDYSQPGAYFITVCTWQKKLILGEIFDHRMKLSFAGRVVEKEIKRLPSRFINTNIIDFVIMPNHIHMVIEIMEYDHLSHSGTGNSLPDPFHDAIPRAQMGTGSSLPDPLYDAIPRAPTEQFGQLVHGSIPTIVRSFKSSVSYHLHFTRDFQDICIWQRNYYEHIIRSPDELESIRNYIASNPANWLNDDLY